MGIIHIFKKRIDRVAFWSTFSISVVLIITSFIMPPTGAIDPTVLAASGELFAWASLAVVIKALSKGTDVSFSKGDVNVNLNNPEEEEEGDEETEDVTEG